MIIFSYWFLLNVVIINKYIRYDLQGNQTVAYDWQPDIQWGTNLLWQANLTANQTTQRVSYNYLITEFPSTTQLAINSQGQPKWKALFDTFGNSVADNNNQINMNLYYKKIKSINFW